MNHPSTPSIKTTLGAVLALTAVLLAAQARADVTVYQDNCNGNDFSTRYTFDSVAQNAGYSAEFPPASSGNMAMADTIGLWNKFQTTSYANGNFANTSYTATLNQFVKGTDLGPGIQGHQQELTLTLLNNGYNSTSEQYNGYRFYTYINSVDTYYSGLYRDNQDGTSTTLVSAWTGPFTDSKVINAWSNLTLNVAVNAGSTDLSMVWSGVKADGVTPYTYTVFSYSDTSAGRYTSGSGLGWGLKGAGSGNGYFIDEITVTAVPEPACLSLLALGGLALLRRRR